MSYLLSDIEEKPLNKTKLDNIKLTTKGMLIYGEWSKERLLNLLNNRLLRYRDIKPLPVYTDTQCDSSHNKSLYSIIHNGIYNKRVLMDLEEKGMSPCNIMKAMKYGLLSLNFEELKYFVNYGVEMYIINNIDMWTKKLDEKLIWNLIITGLTENQCWNIVMCGLVTQDKNILCQLLSNYVDVPSILNWPGEIKPVTPAMFRFLEKLDINETTFSYIEKNGIDDEVENMLFDLGYNEYEEKESSEEILCECNMAALESLNTSPISLKKETSSYDLNKATSSSSISLYSRNNLAPFTCACYENLLPMEQVLKRNDYLRQNVMVPLSWAIGRALKYQPSDPKHYIAYQLLRWKYGNVSQEEINNIQKFVSSATIAMDQRLVEKYKREEEDTIKRVNEATIKNILCNVCLERQKFYRVKERCWKCKRIPASAYNKQELSKSNSFYQINSSSDIPNSTLSSSMSSVYPDTHL